MLLGIAWGKLARFGGYCFFKVIRLSPGGQGRNTGPRVLKDLNRFYLPSPILQCPGAVSFGPSSFHQSFRPSSFTNMCDSFHHSQFSISQNIDSGLCPGRVVYRTLIAFLSGQYFNCAVIKYPYRSPAGGCRIDTLKSRHNPGSC